MTESNRPQCETCRYFTLSDFDKDHGTCHRYPPNFYFSQSGHLVDEKLFDASFCSPYVPRNAWCGEWEAGDPFVEIASQALETVKLLSEKYLELLKIVIRQEKKQCENSRS